MTNVGGELEYYNLYAELVVAKREMSGDELWVYDRSIHRTVDLPGSSENV